MTTHVIYHRVDFDGKCSAAIVLRAIPDAILVPYQYGDEIDLEQFRNAHVVLVDCTLQPYDRMHELSGIAAKVSWIDHHKTAIEWFHRQKMVHASTCLVVGEAGCELTWSTFFPREPMPTAVRLLGRYDVWDLKADDRVLPFQYGMRARQTEPDSVLWKALLDGKPDGLLVEICRDGATILRYVKEHDAGLCKSAFETDLDGLRFVCLNAPRVNSQAFESVWDPERHDAMLAFSNSGNRHWTVSMYTTKSGVDVGAVAAARGGGGHAQAAGFQTIELPHELRPEVRA